MHIIAKKWKKDRKKLSEFFWVMTPCNVIEYQCFTTVKASKVA